MVQSHWADVTPGGTWSSSDGSIASIDPVTGDVTAIAVGTVTITYSIGGIYVTYTVTVDPLAPITGPSSMLVGETVTLADATPGGYWTSSDPSVAYIDPMTGYVTGVITGSSVGTATITYTVGSVFVTYDITVNPLLPITGPTDVFVGGTIPLADLTPGGTWSSSDGSIAYIDPVTGIVTGNSLGTVTITYTVGSVYVTYTVNVNVLQPITGPTDVFIGYTIPLADITPGGTWSSSGSAIATIDPVTGVVTGISTGYVTITYSLGGVYVTYTVTVNNLLPITGPTHVLVGANIPLADVTTGGTWSSSNPSVASIDAVTGVVTGAVVGSVTITYTVGSAYVTYTVTVDPLYPITGTTTVCATSTVTLSEATPGGAWSSSNTSIATITSGGMVTGIAAGTTTISYSASGVYTTAVVTVNPLPNAGSISGSSSVCAGATTTLTNAITGGVWGSSNTAVATATTGGTITGVTPGTATISYSVTNSCGTAIAVSPITVNPVPNAGSITGVTTVCAGSTTTLSDAAAGGVWSSTNTTVASISATGVVTGIAAGTATISYTSTTVCGTAAATAVVTVNPLPVAGSIAGTTTVCATSITTLSSSAGGGVWSSSNTTIASVTTGGVVTGVSAGNATISYTVTNSCGTAYATAAVTVNPLPVAGSITGTTTVCAGSTTSLTDAASGGVWSSSNTAVASITTTGTVTGVAAGTATMSYSVTNSCGTAIATAVVTVNPLPVAGSITGTTTVCTSSTTTLSDASSGGAWTSSNSIVAAVSSTGVVTGVSAGVATISYTVTNSCGTAYTTVSVTVNALPNAGTITGASTICMSATATLSDASAGGVWSSSNTSVVTVSATGVITATGVGSATISYTVTTPCGTASATSPITINPLPNAGSISGTTTICQGGTTLLTDGVTGGVWTSGNATVTSVNSASGLVTGIAAGTANITYTVTNSCGTASVNTLMTINPSTSVAAISGSAVVCQSASTLYTDATSGGVWSSKNPAIASVDASGNVTGVTAGTTCITYTISTTCGTAYATKSITINPLPTAGAITGSSWVCMGQSITLSNAVTGGVWTSSNSAVAIIGTTGTVTSVTPGTSLISYAVTNTCGTAVTTAVVAVNGIAPITGATVFCSWLTTTLSNTYTGGTWSSANTAIASVDATSGVVAGVTVGTTRITYTNPAGCISSTSVYVSPAPTAITGTTTLCVGYTSALGNVGIGTWSSSLPSVASINPTTGVVTAVSVGTSTISYNTTCGSVTTTVRVNSAPSPIAGSGLLCPGSAVTFIDTTAGGYWTSSDTTIAIIGSSTGIVTGLGPGAVTISYTSTVLGGCSAVTSIVVKGPPAITSLSVTHAAPLTTMTITGSNFNAVPANNIVTFGGVRASVISSSSSTIVCTVPVYATFMPISVINTDCALTAFSQYPFLPTYDNSPYVAGIINFDTHLEDTAGTQPYSVAMGDLDGDGKTDIVVTNIVSNTVSLYRNTNTGPGPFSASSFAAKVDFATGVQPYMVAVGDLDGDGKPELAIANRNSNTLSVFRNTATPGVLNTSSFSARVDYTTPVNPISVTIGDIDGDGKPDIVTTNVFIPYSVSVFKNSGNVGTINSATFSTRFDFPTGAAPYFTQLGDIDGDGKRDMVVVNANDNTVSVYRNTATLGILNSSTFAPRVDFATGALPVNVQIADVDGDAKLDLVVTNQNANTISVLRNTAVPGTITTTSFAGKVDFATGSAPISAAMGDIDGDSRPDLVVSNSLSNTISVLRNVSASGTIDANSFATKIDFITGTGPRMISVGDLDGDYFPDVALASLNSNTLTLLRNIPSLIPPSIINVTPNVSQTGTVVSVTGTHFSPLVTGNNVVFGAVKATVLTASDTLLTCIAPFGATYNMVSVNNIATVLTGYAQYPFLPTYDNSAYVAGTVNFLPKVDFTTATNPYAVAIGDIDGDGKPDLVASNYASNTVSVFRNLSTTGAITTGSFAAKVDFATGSTPIFMSVTDIDGDSKPEIIVANNGSNTVSILRNTATSGVINASSFAAKVDFVTGSSPIGLAVGDMDGDGRVEIVTSNNLSNTISVFHNTANSGVITTSTFAPKVDFATGNRPCAVVMADLDKDGKLDIAVVNQSSNTISVFRSLIVGGVINSTSIAGKVDFVTGTSPQNLAVVDIDQDGNLDIAVTNNTTNNVSVFRNTSSVGSITTGSFAAKVDFAAGTGAFAISIGDIDGDTKPDMVVSNQTANTVSVIRNTATIGAINAGSFAAKVDFATGTGARYVAVGDLDADGKADIVVANISANTISVLKNNPIAPISGFMSVCGLGTTTTLSDITPGGTWSSSTTSVATIGTAGVVTGVALGSTTITYTLPGGRATAVVRVGSVPASISGTASACQGSTATLTDVGGGTWSSGNGPVATVGFTTGVVSGVSGGTAVITYTLSTGCRTTKVFTVNPLPNAGTITGPTSVAMLSAITLADAAPGGSFTSSNTLVAAVVPLTGVVTGVLTGTSTISYTVTNGCGTAVATQVVTVVPVGGRHSATPTDTTHAGPVVSAGSTVILVSPNPNDGEFEINGSLVAGIDETVSIEMTNMLGQVVYTSKVPAVKGKFSTEVSFDRILPNGMYLLNIHSTNENKTVHIVVEQ